MINLRILTFSVAALVSPSFPLEVSKRGENWASVKFSKNVEAFISSDFLSDGELLQKIDAYVVGIERGARREKSPEVKWLIAPHAGYAYSGFLTYAAYASVPEWQRKKVKTIVILYSCHAPLAENIFKESAGVSVPTGVNELGISGYRVGYDDEFARELVASLKTNAEYSGFKIVDGDEARRLLAEEYPVGVHIPVIRKVFGASVQVVTIGTYGNDSDMIDALADFLGKEEMRREEKSSNGKQIIFVVSSDMTHWGKQYDYTRWGKNGEVEFSKIQDSDFQVVNALDSWNRSEFDSSVNQTLVREEKNGKGNAENGHVPSDEEGKNWRSTICGTIPMLILLSGRIGTALAGTRLSVIGYTASPLSDGWQEKLRRTPKDFVRDVFLPQAGHHVASPAVFYLAAAGISERDVSIGRGLSKYEKYLSVEMVRRHLKRFLREQTDERGKTNGKKEGRLEVLAPKENESTGEVPFYSLPHAPFFSDPVEEVFVTLYKISDAGEELAGCIGMFGGEPLAGVLQRDAERAAMDSRFLPRREPLSVGDLKIEVSLLKPSAKEEVPLQDRVCERLKKHSSETSTVLAIGGKSAIYLPSVWKEFKECGEYLSSLARKAGSEATKEKIIDFLKQRKAGINLVPTLVLKGEFYPYVPSMRGEKGSGESRSSDPAVA